MTEWSGDDVQQAKDQHNMWPLDEYNIKLLNEVHPKSWANNANTNADDDGEYEGANNEMVFDFIAIGAGAGGLVSSRQVRFCLFALCPVRVVIFRLSIFIRYTILSKQVENSVNMCVMDGRTDSLT